MCAEKVWRFITFLEIRAVAGYCGSGSGACISSMLTVAYMVAGGALILHGPCNSSNSIFGYLV